MEHVQPLLTAQVAGGHSEQAGRMRALGRYTAITSAAFILGAPVAGFLFDLGGSRLVATAVATCYLINASLSPTLNAFTMLSRNKS